MALRKSPNKKLNHTTKFEEVSTKQQSAFLSIEMKRDRRICLMGLYISSDKYTVAKLTKYNKIRYLKYKGRIIKPQPSHKKSKIFSKKFLKLKDFRKNNELTFKNENKINAKWDRKRLPSISKNTRCIKYKSRLLKRYKHTNGTEDTLIKAKNGDKNGDTFSIESKDSHDTDFSNTTNIKLFDFRYTPYTDADKTSFDMSNLGCDSLSEIQPLKTEMLVRKHNAWDVASHSNKNIGTPNNFNPIQNKLHCFPTPKYSPTREDIKEHWDFDDIDFATLEQNKIQKANSNDWINADDVIDIDSDDGGHVELTCRPSENSLSDINANTILNDEENVNEASHITQPRNITVENSYINPNLDKATYDGEQNIGCLLESRTKTNTETVGPLKCPEPSTDDMLHSNVSTEGITPTTNPSKLHTDKNNKITKGIALLRKKIQNNLKYKGKKHKTGYLSKKQQRCLNVSSKNMRSNFQSKKDLAVFGNTSKCDQEQVSRYEYSSCVPSILPCNQKQSANVVSEDSGRNCLMTLADIASTLLPVQTGTNYQEQVLQTAPGQVTSSILQHQQPNKDTLPATIAVSGIESDIVSTSTIGSTNVNKVSLHEHNGEANRITAKHNNVHLSSNIRSFLLDDEGNIKENTVHTSEVASSADYHAVVKSSPRSRIDKHKIIHEFSNALSSNSAKTEGNHNDLVPTPAMNNHHTIYSPHYSGEFVSFPSHVSFNSQFTMPLCSQNLKPVNNSKHLPLNQNPSFSPCSTNGSHTGTNSAGIYANYEPATIQQNSSNFEIRAKSNNQITQSLNQTSTSTVNFQSQNYMRDHINSEYCKPVSLGNSLHSDILNANGQLLKHTQSPKITNVQNGQTTYCDPNIMPNSFTKHTQIEHMPTKEKHHVETSIKSFKKDELLGELLRRNLIKRCVCGSFFDQADIYELHKSVHHKEQPLRCAYCGYIGTNWTDFHIHLYFDHNK